MSNFVPRLMSSYLFIFLKPLNEVLFKEIWLGEVYKLTKNHLLLLLLIFYWSCWIQVC